MNNSAIANAMRKIQNTQGHNEWKLCFLGGFGAAMSPIFRKNGGGVSYPLKIGNLWMLLYGKVVGYIG